METKVENKCEFCQRTFVREKSLMRHVCEKKRRWMNKDEKYVKLGYMAWKRFYELTKTKSKGDTYTDFMNSKFYIAFTKFGRHMLNIEVIKPEMFIDFVIRSSVPIDEWTRNHVYETYVREISKKESPMDAFERNVLLMQSWAIRNEQIWTNFFREINTTEATLWIRSGRISPWILYTSHARKLIDRMTDEQMGIVSEIMDPSVWNRKKESKRDDIQYMEEMLEKKGF